MTPDPKIKPNAYKRSQGCVRAVIIVLMVVTVLSLILSNLRWGF